MLSKQDSTCWKKLAAADPSIGDYSPYIQELARKKVVSERYSRQRLFDRMLNERVYLCTGFPSLLRRRLKNHRHALAREICELGKDEPSIRYRQGPSDSVKYARLERIIGLWLRGQAVMGFTDFHIRDTALESIFNISLLSDFNLLAVGSDLEREQEMMTLVLSTENNLTDSHSDDPDVSNHCFTGAKLWLVWETFEGLENGLGDVEREYYDGNRAPFDLRHFLKLRSSRWLVIKEGQTLFLPGKFTHKVFTLEKYIGLGSFYVSLPNCLGTLNRWAHSPPLWEVSSDKLRNADVPSLIAATALSKIDSLFESGAKAKKQWGVDYLPLTLRKWLPPSWRYDGANGPKRRARDRFISGLFDRGYRSR